MDAWRERLVAMERRMDAWVGRFGAELRGLRRARKGWFRRLSPAEEEELALQARRAAGEELLIELFAFFDELCAHYLGELLPQERAKMRAQLGALPRMFEANWSYAAQNVDLIRSATDERRLLFGLAAVSLDDLRADALEVDALLGRLWIAARRADIDPRPAFARVAGVSNPGTGGGGAFLKRHLGRFEGSLHFKQHVAPALRPAART